MVKEILNPKTVLFFYCSQDNRIRAYLNEWKSKVQIKIPKQ